MYNSKGQQATCKEICLPCTINDNAANEHYANLWPSFRPFFRCIGLAIYFTVLRRLSRSGLRELSTTPRRRSTWHRRWQGFLRRVSNSFLHQQSYLLPCFCHPAECPAIGREGKLYLLFVRNSFSRLLFSDCFHARHSPHGCNPF